MVARIYKSVSSPTQSGQGTNKWVIEFTHEKMTIDPIMGWASSYDTMHEIKMTFNSEEEAIRFACENNYKFEVIPQHNPKIIKKSYSDNFV